MQHSTGKLKVAVVGPTGFTGSHAIKELLDRGHLVSGFSRDPAALGVHEAYSPISVNLFKDTIQELASEFQGHDVLLNAFGPHSTHHLSYAPYLEGCRKILLAAKAAKIPYIFQVGGTGSLKFRIAPGKGIPEDGDEYKFGFDGDTVDSNTFWRLYHETLAKSEAHCKYLDIILPPVGTMLKDYMAASEARSAQTALTSSQQELLAKFEGYADMAEPPPVVQFVKSCRMALMLYEGHTEFRWTFMSPPPNYLPGSASPNGYVVHPDAQVPYEADGKTLAGISAVDLGKAIADEIEAQKLEFKHWTLSADVPNDGIVAPTYLKISSAS